VGKRQFDDITESIIGTALKVHGALGPGLLESAYEACLAHEIVDGGLTVEQQKPLPLEFRGVHLDCGYRPDSLVEDTIIVEIKAVHSIDPIHRAQLLLYLKPARKPVGLLINFHVQMLKSGIQRVVCDI
jgi:GxxExxY protein